MYVAGQEQPLDPPGIGWINGLIIQHARSKYIQAQTLAVQVASGDEGANFDADDNLNTVLRAAPRYDEKEFLRQKAYADALACCRGLISKVLEEAEHPDQVAREMMQRFTDAIQSMVVNQRANIQPVMGSSLPRPTPPRITHRPSLVQPHPVTSTNSGTPTEPNPAVDRTPAPQAPLRDPVRVQEKGRPARAKRRHVAAEESTSRNKSRRKK